MEVDTTGFSSTGTFDSRIEDPTYPGRYKFDIAPETHSGFWLKDDPFWGLCLYGESYNMWAMVFLCVSKEELVLLLTCESEVLRQYATRLLLNE